MQSQSDGNQRPPLVEFGDQFMTSPAIPMRVINFDMSIMIVWLIHT